MLSEPQNRSPTDHSEARSALDLIFGHLTDTPRYVPVSRPSYLSQLHGWYRPSEGVSPDQYHLVAKIQRFRSGGYEVTVTPVELEELARKIDAPRSTGKREKPEEQDQDSIERSEKRAKKRVRHLIKSMGCDRLFTLTRRESSPEEFWTRDQWVSAWDRFVRLCKKAKIDLSYVAVLELHKKGNFHLHVGLTGHINIKLARRIWHTVLGVHPSGKAPGNVDVKFKQHLTDYQRRAGLAKYVSKYITKGFGSIDAFNKKRYFASRHDLPAIQRVILNSQTWVDALGELSGLMAFDPDAAMRSRSFYKFAGKDGFWLNFTEDIVKECPF